MRLVACVLGLLVLSACGSGTGSPPSPPETSGHEQDDAPDAGLPPPDAGVPDAGTPKPDAGTPKPDAGTPAPDAGTPDAGTSTTLAWPELQTSIPSYALTVSPEDQEELDEHIDDRDFLVPARFTFEGHTWQVQVRYRGRSTRY
jgi:spore coat protein H